MFQKNHVYHHGDQTLHGCISYPDNLTGQKPGVLVMHDWSGRNAFACEKADLLASLGYVGFAIDMYGEAQVGETTDEKIALMTPLINDRTLLQARARAGFEALQALPEVDNNRIAAIGFCFGGLCVLDLARSGLDFKAAVSFHGLLGRADNTSMQPIKPAILALHGYDDPMVPPEQVQTFCKEMTTCEADWQIHMYGHTQHAFTNPQAHDKNMGTIYNSKAEARAFQAMRNFLKEML